MEDEIELAMSIWNHCKKDKSVSDKKARSKNQWPPRMSDDKAEILKKS